MFELVFTRSAQQELDRLEGAPRSAGLVKQIKRTLGFLQTNPRHPSLQTHVFHSLEHPSHPREKVFEAYVQQHTPAAYRLFWCYGPDKGQITVIATPRIPDARDVAEIHELKAGDSIDFPVPAAGGKQRRRP